MMTDKLKVGDKLAFKASFGRGWTLEAISKITPSGRIVTDYHTLNPDLTIRGRGPYEPSRAHLVTPEIKLSVWRERIEHRIRKASLSDLSVDQLRRIWQILKEPTEGET